MRYQEIKIIQEDKDLFEINMSPGNLDKLASQIDARAGMEFEMIVPNVGSVDLDPEYERDEDADRRARSFDDVEEFFNDGDYNSSRDVRRLIGELQEAYMEWKMERTSDDWIDQGEDYIRDYIVNNDLFDRDEAMDTARESVKDAFPDVDPDSEEFQTLISISLDKREEQFAEDEFESQGRIYNDAFEEFSDEKNEEYDESDFLEETSPYMSDVESNYDIQWPYYIDINQNQSGEVDIDRVADEFSSAIGRPVNSSSRYHGATREKGKYVVEPDGSLEPDDSDDSGLEFVSPPLPLEEMFSDLDKVKKWADETGCYTNSSTGLHINVSVPEFNIDNLDYIKLALLMGDKYVLEQFDRLGNIYTKSAMDKIVERIRQRPEDAEMLLGKMREGLGKLATKVIHSGSTEKYTSINTKTGYVEFRSPGGDWLNDKFFNQIKPTLSRFVVALDAAMDPEKYRDEYLKKLYTLLKPKSKEDTLSYFARYAAGEMPKAALKSFIKQAQLERKVAKDPTGGQKYWWNVQWDANRRMEVVAGSKEVAIQVAAEEWGVPESQLAGAKVTPLRPYDQSPARASIGEPQPASGIGSQTDMENRLGWGSQAADANYEIVDRQTNRPVFLFIANTDTEAWRKYSDWLAAAGYPEDPENYGWRPRGARGQHAQSGPAAIPGSTIDLQRQRAAQAQQIPEVPLDIEIAQPTTQSASQRPSGEFTGQWLIQDPQGRTIHRFGGVGNVQSDANRAAITWLRAHPGSMQAGVTVVPEMS
jgi:hypothetical protein